MHIGNGWRRRTGGPTGPVGRPVGRWRDGAPSGSTGVRPGRVWILLFVCAVLASPVTLDGQEPVVADSSGAQSAERPSEKSLLLIPLLELYVPTLGYSYAGHWRRGIPSGLTRLVGFGLVMHADQFILGEGGRSCEGACALGSVLVIGGTAWLLSTNWPPMCQTS